jgi:hypothetical protein
MEGKIERALVKFIASDNYSQFMKELMDSQSIDFEKAVLYILDNVEHINNGTKVDQLAQLIAQTCFSKQELKSIDDHIYSIDGNDENFMRKIFFKKVLREIGKNINFNLQHRNRCLFLGSSIGSANASTWNFIAQYGRLPGRTCTVVNDRLR